jgi:hypothetical protein
VRDSTNTSIVSAKEIYIGFKEVPFPGDRKKQNKVFLVSLKIGFTQTNVSSQRNEAWRRIIFDLCDSNISPKETYDASIIFG